MAEQPPRSSIFTFTVDRPVATIMVVIAVVVFGYVSLRQLPVNLMPEINYPTVTVRTEYPGAAPEEVEDEISEAIEDLVGTVEGVIHVESISRASQSDVVLQFEWNTNLDYATQKVRERLSLIQFSDGVERPNVYRYDPSLDPILRIAIWGDVPLATLRTFAEEEVERALDPVNGVAMVRVLGGEEEVIAVHVREGRMEAYGLTIEEIDNRLRSENVNLAGGRLFEGNIEYLVRTQNELETIEDIGDVAVARRNGGTIRLRDVADISLSVRDRTMATRIDGHESVEIAIYKEADANLVAVAESVLNALIGPNRDGEGGLDRPAGVELTVLSDQSTYIRAAVAEVSNTAMLGGLCAVCVLFVFLRRFYATMIIGLAIPLSVIATFAGLRLLGVSLNIMSLGGIALGVGMLVDNAVVVLESIVRCREEGDGPRAAAMRGTTEVGGAVVASTLTTVAVFFPIVFVEGVAGQLFGDLAIAVVLSLVASLGFALWFVPMLAVLPDRISTAGETEREKQPWLRFRSLSLFADDMRGVGTRFKRGGFAAVWAVLTSPLLLAYALFRTVILFVLELSFLKVVPAVAMVAGAVLAVVWRGLQFVARFTLTPFLSGFANLFERLGGGYVAVLGVVLRRPFLIIGGALALAVACVQVYPLLGVQLIPELHQGELIAEVRLPVGTALEETSEVIARAETQIRAMTDVAEVATFIGEDPDAINDVDSGEHYAALTIQVVEARDVAVTEDRVLRQVQDVLSQIPGAEFEITRPTLFSLSSPIQVEVRGYNLADLERTADEVARAIETLPGVSNVRSNMRGGYPEVRLVFDRERLMQLGLNIRDVAETVRSKVQGADVTQLRSGERALDLELATRRQDVGSVAQLRDLIVGFIDVGSTDPSAFAGVDPSMLGSANSAGRVPIRLGAVAEIVTGEGPAEIRHIEGQRAAIVRADTTQLDLGGTGALLEQVLVDVPLAANQAVFVAGQRDELERAQRSLTMAMLLAVFLVYVVMASKFESFTGPFVILLTIPLALVGVVGVLWATGTPVNVVAFIGAIVLAGIVVNNAIVLVDTIIQLRDRGIAKDEAILEACRVRLRPVLITALTTILGLLPMAFRLGEGAEIRRPLAWVVCAGLGSATILTLFVIPVVYRLVGEIGRRTKPAERGGAEQLATTDAPT